MIDIIETVCTFIYILAALVLLIKLIAYKKLSLWPSILLSLYGLSQLLLGLHFSELAENIFSVNSYFKVFNGLILSIGATYISILAAHYVQDLTNKKIKTLIRLPLIGFLAGYAIGFNYVLYTYIILELAALIIGYKQRADNQYIFRAQCRSAITVIVLLFVGQEQSILLPLYFLVSFVFRIPIINAFIVKSLIMKYDSGHD